MAACRAWSGYPASPSLERISEGGTGSIMKSTHNLSPYQQSVFSLINTHHICQTDTHTHIHTDPEVSKESYFAFQDSQTGENVSKVLI